MFPAYQSEDDSHSGSLAMPRLQQNVEAGQTRLLILAPQHAQVPPVFQNLKVDARRHQELLAGMQRLRGNLYLRDGAIEQRELSDDGRHCMSVDRDSWHLLALDRASRFYPPGRFRVVGLMVR